MSTFKYFRWSDINLNELKEICSFSGFQKMAMKYAGFGIKEMARSLLMPLQVMQIQKYIQDITTSDVERGPAGVRAQAMSKDGMLSISLWLFLILHTHYRDF